jgi:2'-5' RNA ligase
MGHATSEQHRLFIAIPLERHFESVFSRYRDRESRIRYLRWVPERKLHITALFIGLAHDELIPGLVGNIWHVAQGIRPFSLELVKVAYAAPGQPVDMVWAYFKESALLDVTVHKLYNAVSAHVIPKDSYKNGRERVLPHVTLARFDEKRRPRELIDLKQTGLEKSSMVVDELQLIESRTGKSGSEYVTLVSMPLGGTRDI